MPHEALSESCLTPGGSSSRVASPLIQWWVGGYGSARLPVQIGDNTNMAVNEQHINYTNDWTTARWIHFKYY